MLFEAKEMIIESQPTVNIYRNKMLVGTAIKEAGTYFFYDLWGNLAGTGPNIHHLMLSLCLSSCTIY